jgi:hypothetical protein
VTPEKDLGRLLASIEPELHPGTYVFCALGDDEPPAGLAFLMLFREPEGVTVVVRAEDARSAGLACEFPCEWITLGAGSDLAAVGFLAEITATLVATAIGANVVSAFHHDHLFVPAGRGGDALAALEDLRRAQPDRG